jgi:hypothetical protein
MNCTVGSGGLRPEFQMLSDDLAELLRGVHCFKTAIKIGGRLNPVVAQQPPDRLVFARSMLQVDGRRGVPELMDRDPQSGRLLDALGNLDAEQVRTLGLAALARKQGGIIGSIDQGRAKLLRVFIYQSGEIPARGGRPDGPRRST